MVRAVLGSKKTAKGWFLRFSGTIFKEWHRRLFAAANTLKIGSLRHLEEGKMADFKWLRIKKMD